MIETHFFSSYLLPIVLAIVIFGMGTSLKWTDFRNIFEKPIGVIGGLVCQLILLPAIALAIAQLSGLRPAHQVGLVLVAACPGGAIANLLSYLMKGNVALSVSFTAINSFITIFTIPIVTNIALGAFMDTQSTLVMPFWETMAHIMLITVVPALIGVWMHGRWPRKTAAMQRYLKVGMPLLLALAMVGAIFLEKKDVVVAPAELVEVLPWALLLNAIAMAAGWATAALLRLGRPAQVTLGLEVGLHNSGLAIAIATSQFLLNHPTAAVPASTFALFSFFTALVYGWLVNGRALDWREMLGIKRH